jgi:phage terminase small subunit
MPAARDLTDAQERFAQEYLLDLNATAAYQRAYPDASAKSCLTAGPRMLGNVRIAARVAELQAERAARVEVSADTVLRELLILAISDVRHFTVSDAGVLELVAGAPDAAWRSVASVKHRITTRGDDDDPFTVREIEYRLWNKPDALKMLGQHLAMFTERREVTGRNGEPLIPAESILAAMRALVGAE